MSKSKGKRSMDETDPEVFILRKTVPVSTQKDAISSNNICLSSQKPTTFGRVQSNDVQVRLLSKTTPLMISRKHATICVNNKSVTILDHDSINGVYIQNIRIPSGVPQEVNVGQIVAFGCGIGSNPPEFQYILEYIHKKTNVVSSKSSQELISPSKRLKLLDSPAITIIESNTAQIKEQEERIHKLTADLEQKELMQLELVNKLEQTEKGLIEMLKRQRDALESERNAAEENLKMLLENQLREKEDNLQSEYDKQLKCLQIEKDLVERNLQAELSKQLSEKDKVYQEVLEQQKVYLEEQILLKEKEKRFLLAELQVKEGLIEKYKTVEENQRQLEECLVELRKEISEKEILLRQQQEATKQIELDAKQTVIQSMEDEFTCIICQELFIDSTTLACAHTFCEVCLRLWMRKKKNCPVCRRKIKDKAVRSLVLDSAVEKMIESMSDEVKERREIVVQQRLEQKRKDDATEDPDGIKNMFHNLGEDNGSADEVDQQRGDRNNDRNHNNRNRHDSYRREGYPRRSRSRSPRYHQRYRPNHHENRNHNYHNNINYNTFQGFHQQNIVPLLQHYQDRSNNNAFIQDTYNQHYYSQHSVRCFNCGGNDHIARFCHRR